MTDSVARAILDTLRTYHGLFVDVIERPGGWRLDAHNQAGERWATEHEDLYRAAVMLAEVVRADVEG